MGFSFVIWQYLSLISTYLMKEVLLRYFVAALVLSGFLGASAAHASISNVSGSVMAVNNGNLIASSANAYTAFIFQTGQTSSRVNSVSIALTDLNQATVSGFFDLELWQASSGTPTTPIASVAGVPGTAAQFPSSNINSYSLSNLGNIGSTMLAPNTQYAIVFKGANAALFAGELYSSSYSTTDGWSYVRSVYKANTTSGVWTVNPGYLVAAVSAVASSPAPVPVPTLSEWAQMLLALMLPVIGWHFQRKRSY